VYQGQELDIFSGVKRWKAYWASRIRSYLGDEVLEVGAGLGTNTLFLCNERYRRWVCLEPDPRLTERIRATLRDCPSGQQHTVVTGTLKGLGPDERFDTILFIDVLEHIKDDREELLQASTLLKRQGVIVVLSPAQPWLFSELDRGVGHFRRYTKKTLSAIGPSCLQLIRLEYLDSIGVVASLSNRYLFKSRNPAKAHVKFWDSVMVPCSKVLDTITFHRFGKSILAVWHNST